MISGLDSTAFALAVYASSTKSPGPTQDALLAVGRLYQVGLATHRVPTKGFRSLVLLSQPIRTQERLRPGKGAQKRAAAQGVDVILSGAAQHAAIRPAFAQNLLHGDKHEKRVAVDTLVWCTAFGFRFFGDLHRPPWRIEIVANLSRL